MSAPATHARVRETSQNGDLITHWFERFERFAKSKISSLALWKPPPIEFWMVGFRDANAVGEVDGAKAFRSGGAPGRWKAHRFEPRKGEGDAGGAQEGSAIEFFHGRKGIWLSV